MIITIGNENVYAVVSLIGATVKEFVCHGENLIYPARLFNEKSRGGIPICFPFFGKSTDEFSGIPQHGWLRNQELELVEQSDIHVQLTGENEPTKEFPWKLKYFITITVDSEENSLLMELVVTRLADGEYFSAPINPGFHPYFCSDQLNAIAYGMANVGNGNIITDFPEQSVKIPVGNPILIKSGTRIIEMVLEGDFSASSCLTLWSDNIEEYFCVEPVLTHPRVFSKLEGGEFLDEGERLEMVCFLKVIQ